jgi:hypothetical protein
MRNLEKIGFFNDIFNQKQQGVCVEVGCYDGATGSRYENSFNH